MERSDPRYGRYRQEANGGRTPKDDGFLQRFVPRYPDVFSFDDPTLDIFAPTDPEMFQAVGARIRPELMSSSQPILTDDEISRAVDPDDEAAKLVLNRVNARKPVEAMYKGPSNLQAESVNGFIARLEHGRLGLIRP